MFFWSFLSHFGNNAPNSDSSRFDTLQKNRSKCADIVASLGRIGVLAAPLTAFIACQPSAMQEPLPRQQDARSTELHGALNMTRLLAAIATILLTLGAVAADDDLDATFGRDILIIEASAHACHRFDIYLALNDEQRARGLMHVRGLPVTTGMLFAYEGNNYASMWMKNTYIPLDIVFARGDGRISSIARDTEPLSLRSIRSIEAVTYVLELNAGTTERLFIDENSRLLWGPIFDLDE